MSGINKVILVGHLGKDPEVRNLEGGVSVTSFPLATSESFNKDGKKVEQTEWHNIVMWRGLADMAVKILQKGKLVYITCSVFKQENETVAAFIENHLPLELIKMELLTGYYQKADTMFAALFRKTS